jgi:hypothetical protein
MPATVGTAGALVTPAQLELAQCVQQLRDCDLADRAVAEGGKRRLEQPAVLAERRFRAALAPLLA